MLRRLLLVGTIGILAGTVALLFHEQFFFILARGAYGFLTFRTVFAAKANAFSFL